MAGLKSFQSGDALAAVMNAAQAGPSAAAVQSAILNNCITLGAATALIYDYVLTLPTELKIMWSHNTPLSGAKVLFFLNRYCSLGYWICLLLKDFTPIRTELGCKVLFQFADAFIFVTNISILCIFLLRTYAIYHQSKVVLFGLGSIVVARIITNSNVTYTQAFIAVTPVPALPYTSSCTFHTKPSYDKWFLPDVCLFIIFDTIVLILTITRTIVAAQTVSIAYGNSPGNSQEIASGSSGTSRDTAVSSGHGGAVGKDGVGPKSTQLAGGGKQSSYRRWTRNLNLNFRQNLCFLLLRDGIIYYSFIEFTWIYEICTQRIPGVPASLKATNVTFQQTLSSILVNRLVLNLRQAGRSDPAYTNASGSGDLTTDYEVPQFRVRSRRVRRDEFDDDFDDYEFDEGRGGEGTWDVMSTGSTVTNLRAEGFAGTDGLYKEVDGGVRVQVIGKEARKGDEAIGDMGQIKNGGLLSLNVDKLGPNSPGSPASATTIDVDSPLSLLPKHRQASGLDLWPKQIRKQRQQTHPIPSSSSSQLPISGMAQPSSALPSAPSQPTPRTQPRSRSRSNSQNGSPNRRRTSPQSQPHTPMLSSAQERILGNLGMQVDDGLSEVFFGDDVVRRWDRSTAMRASSRTRRRRMRSGTVPGPHLVPLRSNTDPSSLADIEEGVGEGLGTGGEVQPEVVQSSVRSNQRNRARAASTSVRINADSEFEMVGIGPSSRTAGRMSHVDDHGNTDAV